MKVSISGMHRVHRWLFKMKIFEKISSDNIFLIIIGKYVRKNKDIPNYTFSYSHTGNFAMISWIFCLFVCLFGNTTRLRKTIQIASFSGHIVQAYSVCYYLVRANKHVHFTGRTTCYKQELSVWELSVM